MERAAEPAPAAPAPARVAVLTEVGTEPSRAASVPPRRRSSPAADPPTAPVTIARASPVGPAKPTGDPARDPPRRIPTPYARSPAQPVIADASPVGVAKPTGDPARNPPRRIPTARPQGYHRDEDDDDEADDGDTAAALPDPAPAPNYAPLTDVPAAAVPHYADRDHDGEAEHCTGTAPQRPLSASSDRPPIAPAPGRPAKPAGDPTRNPPQRIPTPFPSSCPSNAQSPADVPVGEAGMPWGGPLMPSPPSEFPAGTDAAVQELPPVRRERPQTAPLQGRGALRQRATQFVTAAPDVVRPSTAMPGRRPEMSAPPRLPGVPAVAWTGSVDESMERRDLAAGECESRRLQLLRLAVMANRERIAAAEGNAELMVPAMICSWRPPPPGLFDCISRPPAWARGAAGGAARWLRSGGFSGSLVDVADDDEDGL